MAHVELSLTESLVPPTCDGNPAPGDGSDGGTPAGPLPRWAATVAGANEPCLVIDGAATVVAASPSCRKLLGMAPAAAGKHRFLLDCVGRLVDFTAAREELTQVEIDKIPPLLALSSGRLARGLMRVYDGGDFDVTVDAIATPLCGDDDTVVGSLTFFSAV